MDIERLKRQENKYFINYKSYLDLKKDLSIIMKKDQNSLTDSYYQVRSLYFDDHKFSAIDEKLSGEKRRMLLSCLSRGSD